VIVMGAKDTHVPFGGFPLIGHKEFYVVEPHHVSL
jgi:hypothetical protein